MHLHISLYFQCSKNGIAPVIEGRRNLIIEKPLKLLPQNTPAYPTSSNTGVKFLYGTLKKRTLEIMVLIIQFKIYLHFIGT